MNDSQDLKFKTKFDLSELPSIIVGYKKQIRTMLDTFTTLPEGKKDKLMNIVEEISNLSEDLGMNIVVEKYDLRKIKVENEKEAIITKELSDYLKETRKLKKITREMIVIKTGLTITRVLRHEKFIGSKVNPETLVIIAEAMFDTDEEWQKLDELVGIDISKRRKNIQKQN